MNQQGDLPAAGAGDNAPAEVPASGIGGSRAMRPSNAKSMKVSHFSSATWASDADFEAAIEHQHQKVSAGLLMTQQCTSLCCYV